MIQNVDRVPVEVLENGAIRHGIYDSDGDLLRYEYIKREDAAVILGTAINKIKLDEMLAASGETAGTGAALTLAQGSFSLFDGAQVRIKLHTAIEKDATLNVNGTGAVPIIDSKGAGVKAGPAAGAYLTLMYNGSNFVLQGEGGGATSRFGNGVNQISSFEWLIIGHLSPYYGRQERVTWE